MKSALTLEIVAQCSRTKARVTKLKLPHGIVDTPVFMPVGTQGTLKGLTVKQLEDLGCQIMLNNTYHLVMVIDIDNKKRELSIERSLVLLNSLGKFIILGFTTRQGCTRRNWGCSRISKLEKKLTNCKK